MRVSKRKWIANLNDFEIRYFKVPANHRFARMNRNTRSGFLTFLPHKAPTAPAPCSIYKKKGQAAMEFLLTYGWARAFRPLTSFATKAREIRSSGTFVSLRSTKSHESSAQRSNAKKKGQAAMEFLLTYGWAILAVLTAISALAYFGVLDPTKYFTQNTCTLPVGLSCLDSALGYEPPVVEGMLGTNTLTLNIKNNLGSTIKLDRIVFSLYSKTQLLGTYPIILNSQQTGRDGIDNIQVDDITDSVTTNQVFNTGDKYEIEFTLMYKNTESDLPHTVTGIIRGKVS